jgi:hypothetical protein
MSTYIVDNFSDVLTQEDISDLFGRLQSSAGSLAKAAELCKLERKTVYDWEKTGYVKLSTKRKVLKALLENLSKATLGFITRRTYNRAQEAFRIYISTMYEQCVTETKADNFLQEVAEFESAVKEYRALAQDLWRDELPQMLYELSRHAQKLGTKWKTAWTIQPEDKAPEIAPQKTYAYWTAATIQPADKIVNYRYYMAEYFAKVRAQTFIDLTSRFFREYEALSSEMKQSTATTGSPSESRYMNQLMRQVFDPTQPQVPGELAVS